MYGFIPRDCLSVLFVMPTHSGHTTGTKGLKFGMLVSEVPNCVFLELKLCEEVPILATCKDARLGKPPAGITNSARHPSIHILK